MHVHYSFRNGSGDHVKALLLSLAAVYMTAVMIAALYAHRRALPVVGAVFGALIVFGLMWSSGGGDK